MNRSIKGLFLSMLLVVLTGCQSHKVVTNTFNMAPKSNWPDQHRAVAMNSYLYAQMSNNTYGQAGDDYCRDGNDFILPPEYRVEHFGNKEFGFAYSIYKKSIQNALKKVIVAFRGTEGLTNFDDVWHGNVLARQNPMAITLYQNIRSQLDESGYGDIPIVLTGHSLGGALAIHVAINVDDNLSYYVFNSSPRFNKNSDEEKKGDERHSIVETGEFLYSVRFPATEATQTYTPFNCEKNFKTFTSHNIEKLATCLTMVAALNIPGLKVEMTKKQPAELL